MNAKGFCLLITLTLVALFSTAQKKELNLLLRSGQVKTAYNILPEEVNNFNAKAARTKNKTFAVLQFEEIPSETVKKNLERNGIELLEYVPENAYTVIITGNVNAGVLQSAKARALIQLTPQQKMFPSLADLQVPGWAVKVPGTIDVLIKFPKAFSAVEVVQQLKEKNIDIIADDLKQYNVLSLRIAVNRLHELAAYPFIEYVQPQPPQDHPLNLNSRNGSRANVLNASVANGGRELNGEGVVVGIGDNADVQYHIDFAGRLINRAAASISNHGTHTTGTLAGGGIINEQLRGYAPKATIVSQVFSGIINNAATYVNDYGMVVTNNSYGNIVACDFHGTYDIYSNILDQQAFDLPYLQHVFAAGNSGGDNCAPYPQGFRTILGGYQTAKNVISVGNTDAGGTIYGSSSKGPVKDGRTKPEITAMGAAVLSTISTNNYGYSWGTSMASPAVSGGLVLLYQRYRQLNSGANPKSGLIKALACNGATDKGNSGPDYTYGFGWLNLLRSVDMMEKGRYFTGSIANSNTTAHNITVPANTAQLKVMLYWHDPAASIISSKALVNDLDLEVKDAANNITLPKKLDTTAANVRNAATTGADHINNIEQVIINNPAEGTYTFNVKGTAITQNPSQEYFVVYDLIPAAVTLTFPFGGEALVPGEQITLQWDANDNNTNTFSLQYSTDNGATWSNIATSVAATARQLVWTVPSIVTSNALVRIQQNGTSTWSTSGAVTIIGVPTVSLSSTQCEGYIALNWTAVSGATGYEVMMLKGSEMTSIATTTATTYSINSLNKDSIYWVSVRTRLNDKWGRRANAISRQPNTGTCSGSISNSDLKLNAIIAPVTGRKFTSSALTNTEVIKVEIKNLDDAVVNNFTVQYSINNGPWVTENIATPIAAGTVYTHQFAGTVDLSNSADYNIIAVVKNNTTDAATVNDTLTKLVKSLDNQPISLVSKFIDNVETASDQSYKINNTGVVGDDRFDFQSSTSYGRLRTFVNTGMAYSGSKAFTLDADRYISSGNINYLTGTYNLSNYSTAVNDVRIDFMYNNHGQSADGNNKVWIRGNDQGAWIKAYDLDINQEERGIYKRASSIEISELLAQNNQQLTSSFQVRWGQFGVIQATDKENLNGYTFDDIRLYEAENDLQLLRIDTPYVNSCGLDNNVPVRVTVRNSSNSTLTNIPVKYRVNGGSWITESIASISAKTSFQYTFNASANLTAFDRYTIQALVDFDSDNFHENDTATTTIINTPVVNTFPYLQNFEADNGYWYAGGRYSSWQYGTPASSKINGAASGAKAWKTRLIGNYNNDEYSYLYSPCFNISNMAAPTLSFSVALDIEDCGTTLCDGAWVEYSEDGIVWKKLGSNGSGYNWYNKADDQLWSKQDYTRWHVATSALPIGLTRLQLRFVMKTDVEVSREGIAIDDIHIYDNTKGLYDGVTLASPVTQNAGATNNWTNFESGGKLFASVNTGNQNLGSTNAQVYVFNTSSRYDFNQYYHARNITIKPENTVSDSVTVRLYFLDSETEALINATGCNTCSKPASAYKLGVSKFSAANVQYENGTIADNNSGLWKFIPPANVTIVPFDKGYYAEFKVKDFSEFWLNNGAFDNLTALPVKLLTFEAHKQKENVAVQWSTSEEENADRFEIEVATGNNALQNSRFVKIGEVASNGNSNTIQTYTYLDEAPIKTGVRYYRLKMVDKDGKAEYSAIKSVLFSDELTWQVFPNPSKDVFNFIFQAEAGETVQAQLLDIAGRKLSEYTVQGNGFAQKLVVNTLGRAAGVYLLQVSYNGKKQIFKLYKQ